MSRRAEVLELAVLGLLHDSPMHGYELRKRLNAVLGAFRALSYGTLYPALKALLAEGLIRDAGHVDGPAPPLAGKRARIVYELTAEGKERFNTLVREPGPAAWEDGTFDVHFAFFARTDAATRLQILERRRPPPPAGGPSGGARLAWRNVWSASAARWRAPASASTPTRSSCSDTVSSRS